MKNFENFIKNLKKFGIKNNIPNISVKNGDFLYFLLKMKNVKKVLEIGCANGFSTCFLAKAMKENDGKCTSYDVSLPSFEDAKKNLEEILLNDFVNFRFGNVLECKKVLDEKFDFIFIDGRKAKTLDFFLLAEKVLDEKGIIFIDDVIKFKEKMANFFEYIQKQEKFKTLEIPIDLDDGIMILYKK